MLDFAAAARTSLEEIDALQQRVGAMDETDLARPTRLEGWDVAQLTRHVAAAIWQQAEAFHRVRLGITEAPSFATVADDVTLVDALEIARRHLVAGLTSVAEGADPMVPLPFAPLPAGLAVQLLLIEYGFHRNDLLHALGDDQPLRSEVAEVQVELLPVFLPMVATRVADEDSGFRLVASTTTTSVVCRDRSWTTQDPPPGRTCEIRGDDSAIALFALGRIGPDHPALEVDDPLAMATRFKDFFPGP